MINPVDKIIDLIEESYLMCYIALTENRDCEFELSEKDLKLVFNFINLLNDNKNSLYSIGKDYITKYFIFQFDYWKGLDTRFGQKIPLSWFIGKKAYLRWVNRKEHDLWHAKNTAKKYNLGKIKNKKKNRDLLKIQKYEELEKSRFFNKTIGFVNCIETTTLYNHRSLNCMVCKYNKDCKKLLKENYPNIYINRGYLKNEKNKIK